VVRARLESEVGMIARIVVTLIMLGFAVNAFWSNAFDAGHLFNPFGIVFLCLTAVVWFAWNTIRESWSQKIASEKAAMMDVKGMLDALSAGRPRRTRADQSSSQQRL
jgi:protein-S-isoprenylcysteine O-methyltransferase Ste14